VCALMVKCMCALMVVRVCSDGGALCAVIEVCALMMCVCSDG
jgi:hypothetical protein